MAGLLTIHSTGDGTLLSDHSWIEYTPEGDKTTTYGTWGNNPQNLGNGLHENLELGRQGDVHRSMHISDEQEKQLFAKIKKYKDKPERSIATESPTDNKCTIIFSMLLKIFQ